MLELLTGTGTAHSILLFALVITAGLVLSHIKIKGMGIGATWILFVGILVSHFGLVVDSGVLSFMKDFGLILFVFSIGLQVGPGFFHSFRKGGVLLNLLALAMILLAAVVTVSLHFLTGEDLRTMVGVMSGAVTNTPGLGAAQQTLSESAGSAGYDVGTMSSAYAVAYPLGVLGVLFLLMIFKNVFKVDLRKEREAIEARDAEDNAGARRMHCEVVNPAVVGRTLSEVCAPESDTFVVSRIMREGKISVASPDFVLEAGDKLLVVTSQKDVDKVRIIFGREVPLHLADWEKQDSEHISKNIVVTKPRLTGTSLRDLNIRSVYGVTVTRVQRAGIELVASPGLLVQLGDKLKVVGTKEGVEEVARLVGNKSEHLSRPNLFLIFAGIALGVLVGSVPIHFPGIPQPVKLGIAGGPLIIAILLGYFGTRLKVSTYTTAGANFMLREIGIAFFLAAVGLGAGSSFVSALVGGGYLWILYGALITLIPILVVGLLGRLVFKLDFYQICGLITGSTTNPPALAYAQSAFGTDYTSVNYATVYPLSMFLRVLVAQLLILFAV